MLMNYELKTGKRKNGKTKVKSEKVKSEKNNHSSLLTCQSAISLPYLSPGPSPTRRGEFQGRPRRVKSVIWIFLLISFVFVYSCQAQVEKGGYVINRDNGQIYLDLGEKHSIEEGMSFRVYRQKEGAEIDVGKVKVTQVLPEVSVASILSQESDMEIMIGDRVEIIQETKEDSLGKSSIDARLSRKAEDQSPTLKYKKSKIGWFLLRTGIAALGGAGYFHRSANEAYSKYKNANSSDDAISFRKKTQLNDKRAKIAMGVSLTLIGISAYLFTKEEDTVEKHDSSISFLNSFLKPYVNYSEIGVVVKF